MGEPTGNNDQPAAGPSEAVAPRPSPGPRHAAPEPERTGHPRRWFLAGAGAAVLAAGGGVGAAFLRDEDEPAPKPAPRALLAAIAGERALVADLDATTGGSPQVRTVIVQARSDHAAHLRALLAIASDFDPPAASASAVRGTARTVGQLLVAERQAATRAAAQAAHLDGRTATLLASISACEAGHAELFS